MSTIGITRSYAMRVEQMPLAGYDIVLRRLGQSLAAGLERRSHEQRHILAKLLQLVAQAAADVVEREAGVVLVEEIRRHGQLGRRVGLFGEQYSVLHVTVRCYDDQQDALVRKCQKLDVTEGRCLALAGNHDAREMGELGEKLRGRADEALRVVGMKIDFELADLDAIELLYGKQGIDEETIAAGGGNPSRRGMGAGDKTEFLEVRQHVPDRGRAQIQTGVARQRSRADRLTFGDIALHQGLEQDLRATVQHSSRFYRIGLICGFVPHITGGLFVTTTCS